MNLENTPPSRADATRAALIAAAIRQFGAHGFEATSTRALAQDAGTNIAAIAYHFGGKDGLRRAAAEHFARTVLGIMQPAMSQERPATKGEARAQLRVIAGAVVNFMVGAEQANDMAAFMLRELTEGGPGIDVVYDALIGPMHRRLCDLWGTATGRDPEGEHVRLAVFAFIGQIFYFRIGRPVVTRRMGWDRIGAAETTSIAKVILANLDTLLDQGHTA